MTKIDKVKRMKSDMAYFTDKANREFTAYATHRRLGERQIALHYLNQYRRYMRIVAQARKELA